MDMTVFHAASAAVGGPLTLAFVAVVVAIFLWSLVCVLPPLRASPRAEAFARYAERMRPTGLEFRDAPPIGFGVKAIGATLEMVERIRQEIRIVGFWRNVHAREVLTRALVRDLDRCGLCPTGQERDLAQRLVALAKENHESLTR